MQTEDTGTNMNPDATPTLKTDCIQRITDYLMSGGLFNPELAIHENVRDLLIDCRTELAEKTNEASNWHQHYRDERDKAQKCKQAFIEQEKEVTRLKELLNRAILSLREYNMAEALGLEAALTPSPEETCDCHLRERMVCDKCQKPEEPANPTCPNTTHKFSHCDCENPTPNAPEWRELGQDEVIQEGDQEWHPKRDSWIACGSFGLKPSDYNPIFRFRTRRPLPEQEEMPLKEELKYLKDKGDTQSWVILYCVKYLLNQIKFLRDELKYKNTND